MIFADKVVQLRKKSGWSQEELAEKLNVTRQSVSKWEGAQSIPDLEKILQLAQIFGVSTDYLLKDELAEAEYTKSDDSSSVRRVSMEEANAFLQVKQATAGRIAFATFLCILSPICLFLLAAASETGMLPIRENLAGGAGMIVMLLLVAVAVAMFISCGGMTSPYAYLEAEVFETEYGVSGMVRERQRQYRSTYTRYNVLGACLCILSAIPLFGGAFLSENGLFLVGMLSVMLLLIGLGVIFFIVGGVNWASMEKLLQEGDYTRTKKKTSSITGVVSTVYWCVAAAVYLACSLPGHSWRESWVIWPVAGVLFAAVMAVCSALAGRKKKKGRIRKGKAADSACPFFHCFTVSGCAPLSADGSRNLLSFCPACPIRPASRRCAQPVGGAVPSAALCAREWSRLPVRTGPHIQSASPREVLRRAYI